MRLPLVPYSALLLGALDVRVASRYGPLCRYNAGVFVQWHFLLSRAHIMGIQKTAASRFGMRKTVDAVMNTGDARAASSPSRHDFDPTISRQ